MQHLFLKGAVTVLAVLLVTSLVFGQVSVPNQITFQGRLTDASGIPVADGSHTVNFTLWTLPVAGVNVWTENTSQTTSGGLFTHNLGSITAFATTLFENNDSLFLQIQADGQTITPRIRLTSAPYARSANNLEVCGSDLLPNIQTGGTGYGEIWLRDSDPSNFLGVNLGAYSNGGALDLHDNAGSTTISLDAGNTGDASAVLPTDAINAAEMLNEPGVSNSDFGGFFFLNSGNITYVVDSVDITIPASGYVEVTCAAFLSLQHTGGTTTEIDMQSGKTRGSFNFVAGVGAAYLTGASIPSGQYIFPASATRLYVESAGTHRYYLHVRYFLGGSASSYGGGFNIRAKYYPTLYGTSSLAVSSEGSNASATNTSTADLLQTITLEEHNARLQAEVDKLKAEMNARLQKLEQQLNQTKQAGVEE